MDDARYLFSAVVVSEREALGIVRRSIQSAPISPSDAGRAMQVLEDGGFDAVRALGLSSIALPSTRTPREVEAQDLRVGDLIMWSSLDFGIWQHGVDEIVSLHVHRDFDRGSTIILEFEGAPEFGVDPRSKRVVFREEPTPADPLASRAAVRRIAARACDGLSGEDIAEIARLAAVDDCAVRSGVRFLAERIPERQRARILSILEPGTVGA